VGRGRTLAEFQKEFPDEVSLCGVSFRTALAGWVCLSRLRRQPLRGLETTAAFIGTCRSKRCSGSLRTAHRRPTATSSIATRPTNGLTRHEPLPIDVPESAG
jgi:hypothetical protein